MQEDVVPVGRIKILDRGEGKAGIFNLGANSPQFVDRPQLLGITGKSPGLILSSCGLVVAGIRGTLVEVVHQMDNDVRTTGLTRECIVLACQHMAVHPQSKFHKSASCPRSILRRLPESLWPCHLERAAALCPEGANRE
jgi:hypothetical protein